MDLRQVYHSQGGQDIVTFPITASGGTCCRKSKKQIEPLFVVLKVCLLANEADGWTSY